MSKPSFYNLAWRWHFYAGLFVIPFMVLLSLTGIVYLFKPQLDQLMYAELLEVQPAGVVLSADQQLARLQQALPQVQVSQYLPPESAERSAQFVAQFDGRKTNLFLDPYSGALLGQQDAENNLQAIARALHGELMIGPLGDRLIELAAGWGIVLVVSGLYLWWPRGQGGAGVLWPRLAARGRLFWRDLHAVSGFWGSAVLLFMLLTGMTWTGFWGAQFAGAWNHFPAQMWDAVPQSDQLARSLNSASGQTVAWAVENTPLPQSDPHAAHHGHAAAAPATAERIGLQLVVDTASRLGVHPGYSVTLPGDAKGVFTIAIFADDPRNDATLHLDQYSGKVLADIRWADYGLVARAVESGAMLHEGRMFGLANQLLMLAVCLLILLGSLSGLLMWWKRRPQGRFGVPPLRHDLPLWKGGVAIMLGLGLLFPLVGASLLLALLLEWIGQRLTRRGAEAVAG
ncbi:PepSY-associated TM helix domain-containing protein [Pseudomonas sp. Gutcm_11s]|uniref:PepSY-associated TM helix domain-containing protein n=1 Tax=Pseudomonas sp. Gutcm_11s TaxID=3026088 RepID=UPI002360875E|nr:PepSY domain-containing protein [Pseudomonas sp. Gutcm_11s]MDD0844794.1 PepSY domain-containing protein [Pseudomonas sp. Gutcm_11s]